MAWSEVYRLGSHLRQACTWGAAAVAVGVNSTLLAKVPSFSYPTLIKMVAADYPTLIRTVAADIVGVQSAGYLLGGMLNYGLSHCLGEATEIEEPLKKKMREQKGVHLIGKGVLGLVVSSFLSSAQLSAGKVFGGCGAAAFCVAELLDPKIVDLSARTCLIAKNVLRGAGVALIAAGAGIPTLSLGGAVIAVSTAGIGAYYSRLNENLSENIALGSR